MPRSKKAGLRGRGRGAHSNNIERRPPGVASSSVLPADIGASQENYGQICFAMVTFGSNPALISIKAILCTLELST